MKLSILLILIPIVIGYNGVDAAEIYKKDGNMLDLYGQVSSQHNFYNLKQEDGDKVYACVGLKGKTHITDQLTGHVQCEYHFNNKDPRPKGTNSNNMSLGFAGLQFSDYGSFEYGRNYSILSNLESWTNLLPQLGDATDSARKTFMTGGSNGVATYRNNNFFGLVDGLNVALQFYGKNTLQEHGIEDKNGEGWGISSTYDIGEGISIGAAYISSNRTEMQRFSGDKELRKKADSWTFCTRYDVDNVYLAAKYSQARNMMPFDIDYYMNGTASKTKDLELTAQYKFDFGLRPTLSYLQFKGQNVNHEDTRPNQNLVKYISIGSTYEFNKNISTSIHYKVNLLHDNKFTKSTGISTDNIAAATLVYQF